MKPSTQTVLSEYNRISRIQRNAGIDADAVAIGNVIAAKYGYAARDVMEIIGESEND